MSPFCVVGFAEDGYERNKGSLYTVVPPLFCSLNPLCGDAHCRGLHKAPSTVGRRNFKTHTAFYLRLRLYGPAVIRQENGAFCKRSSHRRHLELWLCVFVRTELRDLSVRGFHKQKSKTTGDCVFKFPQRRVDHAKATEVLLINLIIRQRSSMSPKRTKSEEGTRK